MDQKLNVLPYSDFKSDDEIDLRELFLVIYRGKWLILLVSFVFGVIGVLYAKSLPNIYKSEALLVPVTDSSGVEISGQLGGLAALAGVNLGGSVGDKAALAIEILKSREFVTRFIQKYDLFVPIMAGESWDKESNVLNINNEIYDIEKKEWVRGVGELHGSRPTNQEGYAMFMTLFDVSQDKTNGLVRVSIEYMSPFLAKEWVSLLVKEINREMRYRELNEAQKSISYLNEQILQTDIADVKSMLFSLIEEQTKTLMLASVREEYVFNTIDPAIAPEKKSGPKRAIIVILAVVFGFVVGLFFVLLKGISSKESYRSEE